MLKLLAYITLFTFSYTIKTTHDQDADNFSLYQTKLAGQRFETVLQLEEEGNEQFDGYRITIDPYKSLRLKAIKELSGDITYEEVTLDPKLWWKFHASAGLRTYNWENKPEGTYGLLYKGKGLKLEYKTNMMGKVTFTCDTETRIALAFVGKGVWYMPSMHYKYLDGQEEYLSTQSIGIEWQ